MNFRDILSAYHGTITDSNAEMTKVEILHAVDVFTGHGISKQKAADIKRFFPELSSSKLRSMCAGARYHQGAWDQSTWSRRRKKDEDR